MAVSPYFRVSPPAGIASLAACSTPNTGAKGSFSQRSATRTASPSP